MRGVTGSALAVTALLGGCNGFGTTEPRLAADDVRALVTVSPVATGWLWSGEPTTRIRSPLALSRALEREIPETLQKPMERAGLEGNGGSHWKDKGRQASSFVSIYRTSEGARAVFAAERTLGYASNAQVGGHPVDVDIGDESWAVRGGTDNAGFVVVGWTRQNAVIGIHVECTPCTSDVTAAAEAWAAAIDDAARAASDLS